MGKGKMMRFSDMASIYGSLADEISRRLFTARLNVSVTGDAGYITMLPAGCRNLSADIEDFRERLLSGDRERTVIVGAGFNGVSIAGQIHMGTLSAFIDNHKCGQTEPATGLPICSLDGYKRQYGLEGTRAVISVSDRNAARSLYAQLIAAGAAPGDILTIPASYRNDTSQYFDLLVPGEHESFVDCGCYDAGTAFRFAGWCGGNGYDRIWCFEPDRASYARCRELCAGLRDCDVYPYGVSDTAGTASFQSGLGEESRIMRAGGTGTDDAIETVALDSFLQGERVTFIKMDIEGAELAALRGAAHIIKEQKPKLAISVYHRPEDIIEIPGLILGLRPDYRLYIRHYSLLLNETVLYAC